MEAASVSIVARTGPIHGVQPNAKAIPSVKDIYLFLYFELICKDKLRFNKEKLYKPIRWQPNAIIIKPAIF